MDRKSADQVIRITDRLFSLAQQQASLQDVGRASEWLLQALWRQLAFFSGPRAATALLGQTVAEASSNWPMVVHLVITDRGVDVSALHRANNSSDSELVAVVCKVVMRDCLGLIATLAGDTLLLAVARRMEAELRGLGTASGVPDSTETFEPNEEDTSAA